MSTRGQSARIVAISHLGDLKLRLTFSDGRVRDLDFALTFQGGIFAELRNPELFKQVAIDEFTGTLLLPNGVDLDPDVLHGDFEPSHGPAPHVLADSLVLDETQE